MNDEFFDPEAGVVAEIFQSQGRALPPTSDVAAAPPPAAPVGAADRGRCRTGDVLGRGVAMAYLSIVALIPLAAVVFKSLDGGVTRSGTRSAARRRWPRCG